MKQQIVDPAEAERQRMLIRIRDEFAQCSISPSSAAFPVEERMLAASEGDRLRTVLYRPAGREAVPVIVMRTCYPKNECIYRAMAQEYVKRGFAVVYQYCRGTGGSEGKWEPNVHERADGKDMLEWLCAQSWVASVGYFGSSYLALTGWAIADIVPNKVKTMYLSHYGTHRFISAYKDGLFRHDILTAWTMENAGFPIKADYLESCLHRPQWTVDEDLWGQRIDWYREYLESADSDAPYWGKGVWKDLKEIPTRVKIPICFVEAWYDHHLGSAIETWLSMPEETRRKSRFLIGAWDHSFEMRLQDRHGKNYWTEDYLRAFEWFYKILENKQQPQGDVLLYTIGADCWSRRRELRENDAAVKRLYLGRQADALMLTEQIPQVSGTVTYRYNPEDPVPSHGGEALLRTREEVGSLLQEPVVARQDVISFVSEPLRAPLTVSGQIRLQLTVASDADDTAFMFKVMEVLPDGRSYNIRTGVTSLGYRNGSPHRVSYTPNTAVALLIDSWDISYQFQAGSRIRLDIYSSDFPQYAVHSNFAGEWAKQAEIKPAEQTIFWGLAYDSCLILPLGTEN